MKLKIILIFLVSSSLILSSQCVNWSDKYLGCYKDDWWADFTYQETSAQLNFNN